MSWHNGIGAAACAAAFASSAAGGAGPPPGDDWLGRAERAIAAREYEASPVAGGLQAPNRAHDLRTWFSETGVRIHRRTGAASRPMALPTGIAAALGTSPSATLQLHASGAGCYSAVLGTVKKADGTRFQAKTP
jgi:hypothetical protein